MNLRKTGYIPVHYLIEFIPIKELITSKVQVKIDFEEGYLEIEYQLNYLRSNIFKVLLLNLLMLNVLAGSPDKMSPIGKKS